MDAQGIKAWRGRVGLSQGKLAKLLGVTVSTVSRWERGEMNPAPYLEIALKAIEKDAGN